jgi:anthranilate synthase component 2
MKILVIDNYDSFTYNLVQILREGSGAEVNVIRNDKIEVEHARTFDKIVLSPGPGIPSEAGNMPTVVQELAAEKSILGICLGHQCIGEVFGGKLRNLEEPVHGKAREVNQVGDEEILFHGLSTRFTVGRYHSWVVDERCMPDILRITAVDDQGLVMAIRHVSYDVTGVQFHPESVLTPCGPVLLNNWVRGKCVL